MAGYRVVKTKGTADYEYILISPNGEELNGGDGLHNQAQLEIQANLIQQEVAKRDEAWNELLKNRDMRIILYQSEVESLKAINTKLCADMAILEAAQKGLWTAAELEEKLKEVQKENAALKKLLKQIVTDGVVEAAKRDKDALLEYRAKYGEGGE